jgi:hypothetical protein
VIYRVRERKRKSTMRRVTFLNITHLLQKGSAFLFYFDRIEPPWVNWGNLFRADEQNNHCPSKEKDEKDEKLFYQFGVHMTSL